MEGQARCQTLHAGAWLAWVGLVIGQDASQLAIGLPERLVVGQAVSGGRQTAKQRPKQPGQTQSAPPLVKEMVAQELCVTAIGFV